MSQLICYSLFFVYAVHVLISALFFFVLFSGSCFFEMYYPTRLEYLDHHQRQKQQEDGDDEAKQPLSGRARVIMSRKHSGRREY